MGDMADDFRAMREHGQIRRAANRQSSKQVLEAAGVAFEVRNNGAHLIIKHDDKTVDFWPGTGKWINRVAPPGRAAPKGFGVFKLLKHLGVSA